MEQIVAAVGLTLANLYPEASGEWRVASGANKEPILAPRAPRPAPLASPLGTIEAVYDYRDFAERTHAVDALLVAAADPLSLALLTPPGEGGADIAIGSTQRFVSRDVTRRTSMPDVRPNLYGTAPY